MTRLKIHFQVLALVSLISACSTNAKSDKNESTQNGGPVETKSPNTDYKPAFSGQTRIKGVKTNTPFSATVITKELKKPWGITSLPDGRFLITEKAGNLRIVTQDGKMSDEIKGIPSVNASGQGGLLGLCIDPNFQDNRMVYWAFSENVAGGSITSLAKGRLADNETTIEQPVVIYRSNTPHNGSLHFGARVLFDKNGYLLLSIGEKSTNETRVFAQDVTKSLGKIIRVTTSGKAAPENPKINIAGALPEIFSYGHRNPQGMALNPVTGDLWQGEHGPKGGDELNKITAGGNYGWPIITYGIEYGGEKIGKGIQQQIGMEQPMYYWDPSISPSGMTFYNGKNMAEWNNNLFMGCLSGQHIVRLVIENNKITGEERLLADENQRFRDVTQGKDGCLYAITDSGRLYKIAKK